MRGDEEFARSLAAAVDANAADVKLQALLARLLLRGGQHERAENRLTHALRRLGPVPELRLVLAQHLRQHQPQLRHGTESPELRLVLSQVLRETERLQEAETHA